MREVSQKVRYIETAKLKLHPDNPRLIKDTQFQILKDSIKDNPEYFEARPILCNKDMVVFAGNMRLRAALDLGLKEVPAIVMDITPEKERELLIRDNVSNGEWQMDVLGNTFDVADLQSFGIGDDVLSFLKAGDPPGPGTEEKRACPRCVELQAAIEGHEKRAGHKLGSLE